jgi:hypothetical protein
MTTPQNMLYRLDDSIRSLIKMFEAREINDNGDNENGNICDQVLEIKKILAKVQKNQEALQDRLDLIIKILSKTCQE